MKCNHLDLKLFQIDWDLTFGVLFINADKTIYARYGTRNSMKADNDVAIEGLAATMQGVLELHKSFPENRNSLAGKQPVDIDQAIPEDYQSLDHFKPELDYDGQVAKSCIHCHQVRDAARLEYRTASQPLPVKLLFPFPSPAVAGIFLDPKTIATVSSVFEDSPADAAGLKAGDKIELLNDQSVASEADVRWLLHNLEPEQQTIRVSVQRDGQSRTLSIELPETWRSKTDLSWRPTSWDLRRMATGGMTLVPLNEQRRSNLDIADGKMALRADHVGLYGNHARAKKAGLQKQDIIISYDGRSDLLTENALIEYALQKKKPGDSVEIEYQRGDEKFKTRIRLQ